MALDSKWLENCTNEHYFGRGDISSMEEKVQNILDRNYDLLYDYFCNVLEREEEYKILRARRCQVLFQIFTPIIKMREPDIKIRGKFISNQVIDAYKEKLKNSTVVILDDIVIHGRGLSDLYLELDPEIKNDNIHVYAHKMFREANSIPKNLKHKLEVDSKIFDWEWRELSTQLVNLIQATVTPYVSFVETYQSKFPISVQNTSEGFIYYDITNPDQENHNIESYVLFERDKIPSLIRNIGYDACIRYYTDNNEKNILIPYVFIKSLSNLDIKQLSNFICKSLPQEKFSYLKDELKRCIELDDALKYRTILISILVNRFYGLYLGNKYPKMFDLSHSDESLLYLCCDEDTSKDIMRLDYESIASIVNYAIEITLCDETNKTDEDKELVRKLKEAVDVEAQNNEKDNVLDLYFYCNRQIDENLVKLNQERKKGLLIKTFYDILDADSHFVSKCQLKIWDKGIAACDMYVIKKDTVCSYARAGEQSFRYIVNEVKKFIIDNNTEDKIEDFLKSKPKNLKERILNDFLSTYKYRLDEWILPEIR